MDHRRARLRLTARPAAAIVAVLALVPGTALAQAYQCRVPQAPISVPAITRDGPVRQAPATGYMLALSWSPEYCRGRQDSGADRRQCSGRAGRFGFVVHGLWPQGRTGAPQWCPTRQPLTSTELARNLCMTPSAQLLAREWAKHGACMASRPEDYFRTVRSLWSGLRWPDFDRLSREKDLTAGRVREAFAQANRAWEREHVGLVINQRGWLEELRLCYDRDFKPVACGRGRWGPADSAPVRIWRGL